MSFGVTGLILWILIFSPLEENSASQRVILGQEISQNPGWVTTAHLVGRQAKVHALKDVHEDSGNVLDERPAREIKGSCEQSQVK